MNFVTVPTIAVVIAAATCSHAASQVLWDNGPLQTGAVSEFGHIAPVGYQWSESQHDARVLTQSNNVSGFSQLHDGASTFRLADDFTIPDGQVWAITSVSLYGWQLDASPTTSPFDACWLRIWRGRPGDVGASLLFGDSTTNRLVSSTNFHTYRIVNTVVPSPLPAYPSLARLIWQNTVSMLDNVSSGAPLSLGPGQYWLEWDASTLNNGQNYSPPLAVTGSRTMTHWNARQFAVHYGAWIDTSDRGNPIHTTPDVLLDLPFQIHGVLDDNCGLALPGCAADIAPGEGDGVVNIDDLLLVISNWGQTGPSRPIGDCAPGVTGDCRVDIDDLLAVVAQWGSCPIGACWLPSDQCTILSRASCHAAGGLGWVRGETCLDSDGDRIPSVYELNTCSPVTFPFSGSHPLVPDTDGDLIRDGDEHLGIVGGSNLRLMGCSPLRKNALIEVDWFNDSENSGALHSHQPTANAIAYITGAFNNAPTSNICGGDGISLILDYGQGGPFSGGNLIPGGDTVIVWGSEFNAYKSANFASSRAGVFYYSLHAHRYDSAANTSIGFAEILGDDHIVTLQNQLTDVNIAHAIMHEFGHNLGLRHGGSDETNGKPNYNSVMNYRYTLTGVDSNCNAIGDGGLDFSRGARAALNELSLNESVGVCGTLPIDWNGNAVIDAGGIARNINCDNGGQTQCGATSAICYDSLCSTLLDHNDWAAIVFTGLLDPDDSIAEIIVCDPPRPKE